MPSGAIYFNPSSGARDPQIAAGVRESAAEYSVDVVEIRPGLDIGADIRSRMAEGQRLFVASGGDGTIHSVIQPLVNTDAVLGVLPVGTFNHFARDMKIPLGWRAALDVALNGRTIQVNTASVNDQFFVNNLSIGLYPLIAAEREQIRKLYPKWRAYQKAAWTAYRKLHHVSLVVESPHQMQTVRTHVFVVAVNPYDIETFGIVAPRTTVEGGNLSVYWLPEMQKTSLIRTMARYFSGKAVPGTDFHSMQMPVLKVQTSHHHIRLGMDGELYDLKPPLLIQAIPKSLQVRVPREPAF